jgi:predicted DNA-binding transcriptional regulator YafY
MPFERSLEIERRLDDVLRLISTGRFSTPMLAKEVGVSIPTISRCVTALRLRGHDIRAERHEDGWRYVLAGSQEKAAKAITMQRHYQRSAKG